MPCASKRMPSNIEGKQLKQFTLVTKTLLVHMSYDQPKLPELQST